MVNRVYVLLDIESGKAEQVAKILRGLTGVVMVDVLEGSPDVIMVVEAGGRQQLARRIVKALASVDSMTENVSLLPRRYRYRFNTSTLKNLAVPN